MKAVRFHEYGGPEVLRIDDVPMPKPGPGRALVRVAATSFNPADIALRSGAFAEMLPLELPHTLGMDLAGTIVELGDPDASFAVNDPVVAFLPPDLDGAAADYVLVPTDLLVPAPRSIPLEDAAALPSTAITALQALFEHGELESGQRVLIDGGGSVVGGLAVQLAVAAGAEVIATAGSRSVDRVLGYGAAQVIDYHQAAPTTDDLEQFDLVFNLAPTSAGQHFPIVKTGGRLVSASTPVDGAPAWVTAIRMAAHPDPARLDELVRQLDAGTLILHIGDRRPLAETAEVHQQRAAGKSLLIPSHSS